MSLVVDVIDPSEKQFVIAMNNPTVSVYNNESGGESVGYNTYSTLSTYSWNPVNSSSMSLDSVVNVFADRMVVPVIDSLHRFESSMKVRRQHEIDQSIRKAQMILISNGDEDLDPNWRIV